MLFNKAESAVWVDPPVCSYTKAQHMHVTCKTAWGGVGLPLLFIGYAERKTLNHDAHTGISPFEKLQ